jgi:hypothetical protein
LLILSGRPGIDGVARRLSRQFGMVLSDGALAVDVDNECTHRIAEPILAARIGL